jgi:hypothetical protein
MDIDRHRIRQDVEGQPMMGRFRDDLRCDEFYERVKSTKLIRQICDSERQTFSKVCSIWPMMVSCSIYRVFRLKLASTGLLGC